MICMLFSSAVARTSAGEPSVICVARVLLDSKDSTTSTSGCSDSKVFSSSPNGFVSDEAAKTVNFVLSPELDPPAISGVVVATAGSQHD